MEKEPLAREEKTGLGSSTSEIELLLGLNLLLLSELLSRATSTVIFSEHYSHFLHFIAAVRRNSLHKSALYYVLLVIMSPTLCPSLVS